MTASVFGKAVGSGGGFLRGSLVLVSGPASKLACWCVPVYGSVDVSCGKAGCTPFVIALAGRAVNTERGAQGEQSQEALPVASRVAPARGVCQCSW